MRGHFKHLFVVGSIVLLSIFSSATFSAPVSSLLAQFNQAQSWSEKQDLANSLLAQKSLPHQQQVAIYSHLAEYAFNANDLPNALQYYKELERSTAFEALPALHFRAIKMQGVVLYYQGAVQQAVVEYSRALAFAIQLKDSLKQANLLSNIGLAYFEMHNMAVALDYYQQAKVIYEKEGSAQDKADILHNIAGIYIRLSRYDSALEMYREVLKVFQQLGDEDGVAQVYGNIAVAYSESRQFQLAIHYNQLALRYYQSIGNAFQLSTKHANLASINLQLNQFDVALFHAKTAQQFALDAGNESLLAAALYVLATAQFAKGDIENAQHTSERSIALAKKYKNGMRIKDGLGMEALLHASQGDFENAVRLHLQYIDYQRSINSEAASSAVSKFQIQFEADKLNQEIIQLKQQQHLQELKISQRLQLTILLSIVAILILITVIAIYRRRVDKNAKSQLTEQVAQRTLELQSVAQELRAANDVKSQFLANISHEIRTPLTAILSQTDDLINGLYEPTQLQDELRVIQRQSEHLKGLINDVLDLSKIEANRLELHISCFDLIQVLNDIYAMVSPQAKAKNLTLVLDNQLGDEFYTKLDLTRVKQILINLSTNAIKFTHSGQVTLMAAKTEQGVALSVKDTGIGMNAAQLKYIFECFNQADNSISRRFGGTGLGLSLSQQLAAMMGGYISVQSEEHKGSEFCCFLPCIEVAKSLCSNPAKEHESDYTALSAKVLLAEDHADNRRLITRYLRSMGLTVIAVENGEQAVEQCLKIHPDFVLLDIQMPVMDGISAFELLRQCGYEQPIFALTANAMSHEIEQYLALGFSDYLAKPIDKERFYRTISEHLEAIELHHHKYSENVDMSDLVVNFKQSLALESELITQHFNAGDYAALQKDCHRVFGAAQMFELNDIATAASALDRACKSKANNHDLEQLVSKLQALFLQYS